MPEDLSGLLSGMRGLRRGSLRECEEISKTVMGQKRISQYICSRYSKVPVGVLGATQHRINESAVLTLISDMLRILEQCVPVLFSGKNFREEGARATKAAAKEIVSKG